MGNEGGAGQKYIYSFVQVSGESAWFERRGLTRGVVDRGNSGRLHIQISLIGEDINLIPNPRSYADLTWQVESQG